MKTNAGNLSKGDFVFYNSEVCQVQKTEFYSPGKGSALMRTKLKNVITGKSVDYTFKSQETVETLEVNSVEMQYLYKDAEFLYFMDERTYQQYQVRLEVVGSVTDFMKEGNKYFVFLHDDKVLNVRPSASERLQVVETEEAVKGDTVSGAKKPAVVETGATVMVPLFVKKGDIITVNPETGAYGERVKG